jgi:hypothetical protein
MEARKLAKSRRNNQLSMRRRKRVQFHAAVKKHDGVSRANAHLDRLILDFWNNNNLDLLHELSRDSKFTDLNNLVIKLRDLTYRVRQAGDKSTVLLPRGGSSSKMNKLHLPHINHVLKCATQVRDKCMRRLESLRWERKLNDSLGLGLVLEGVPDLDADITESQVHN